MSTEHEELAFDSDGIPILTDIVYEDADTPQPAASQLAGLSPAEFALELLESEVFRQKLEELAAELASDIRHRLEGELRSVTSVAISHALENSDTRSRQAIREQLEAALPELLSRALLK